MTILYFQNTNEQHRLQKFRTGYVFELLHIAVLDVNHRVTEIYIIARMSAWYNKGCQICRPILLQMVPTVVINYCRNNSCFGFDPKYICRDYRIYIKFQHWRVAGMVKLKDCFSSMKVANQNRCFGKKLSYGCITLYVRSSYRQVPLYTMMSTKMYYVTVRKLVCLSSCNSRHVFWYYFVHIVQTRVCKTNTENGLFVL